jgi:hypothetical protein
VHSLKILNINPINILSTKSHEEMSGLEECVRIPLTSEPVSTDNSTRNRVCKISARPGLTIIISCFVNLINYMDRYAVAGKATVCV